MAFPATPLDLTVELLLSGVWTDITSLVYRRDLLAITRGRSDEGTEVDRSICKLTGNNRSGNLSPRNPTGIYYGQIGRNTPVRVSKQPAPEGYLLLPTEGSYASTPDSANLSITGDIDLRVDVRIGDWTPPEPRVLASKWATSGNQRSWLLRLETSGVLTFFWSNNGTAENFHSSSVAPTPDAYGRLAVRVTLDVDNGAAGRTMRFYTAPTIGGSFTQLGSDQTSAGVTSIFDSTAVVALGGIGTTGGVLGASTDWLGRILAMELYQGIAGTIRADVDLDDEEATGSDGSSFADGQANTWTLQGDASIVDPSVRFVGEASSWPPRWDVTGTDVYVPMEASGILRRLTQGNPTPLRSTMYRGLVRLDNPPKAYWPCEDGTDATELASGVGGPPMQFTRGIASLAADGEFDCSESLPHCNDAEWAGPVPAYANTGANQIWFLLHVPAAGALNNHALITVSTAGTIVRWNLVYGTGGTLTLNAYDKDGTQVVSSGAFSWAIDGRLLRIGLSIEQNGTDVQWGLEALEVGETSGDIGSGSALVQTVTRVRRIVVNGGGGHTDVTIGHIAVLDEAASLFDFFQGDYFLYDELNAFTGEAAGRRVQRLCGQEGVTFRAVGDLDAAAAMGPQRPGTLVDLLREAADADGGILHEPRDVFGLAYRTRESMYNQLAALTLDYAANELGIDSDSIGIEPVDDDQATRNDVTVRRPDGSSFRAALETGPLSIQAPPDGVGRYDSNPEVNVESDQQLPDQAGWRLALGTVDETRYPVLGVNLARASFTADQALYRAAEDVDLGDRLLVENPPSWLPPEDIAQLAQGFKETMGNFEHQVDANCSPSSLWDRVGVYDETADRYSSYGSTLAEDLTTGETAVDVATPAGPLWSHADGDFDLMVGGERMTVTAVAGASSPQTFTVTRSVNGVVKTHASGATVELFRPVVYAI
jgi:hypothetical protein